VINVYGLNPRYHQSSEISDWILGGSDKWNEHLRIYANFVTADGKLSRGMNEDMSTDPYAMGIVAAPTTDLNQGAAKPTLKMLTLAKSAAGPFIPYTLDTVQNRTYPLHDEIFAFADVAPGKPADPKVIEFLRFILSREGQELVMKDGKYLPLTADVVKEGLAKIDAATAAK
jgi:phosphate transport system substrate-binding protein